MFPVVVPTTTKNFPNLIFDFESLVYKLFFISNLKNEFLAKSLLNKISNWGFRKEFF